MASQEYDLGEDAMDVAKQRKRLRKRLGLDGQMEDLVDTRDLVKDEDLVAAGTLVKKEEAATQQASELLSQMDGVRHAHWRFCPSQLPWTSMPHMH